MYHPARFAYSSQRLSWATSSWGPKDVEASTKASTSLASTSWEPKNIEASTKASTLCASSSWETKDVDASTKTSTLCALSSWAEEHALWYGRLAGFPAYLRIQLQRTSTCWIKLHKLS